MMKFIKHSFTFAFVFALSSLVAFAQETGGVKGKIRTMKGDGIAGASVAARLNGADVKSVKSDGDGRFVLDGLKPGVYNIVFDKSGYASGIKYRSKAIRYSASWAATALAKRRRLRF